MNLSLSLSCSTMDPCIPSHQLLPHAFLISKIQIIISHSHFLLYHSIFFNHYHSLLFNKVWLYFSMDLNIREVSLFTAMLQQYANIMLYTYNATLYSFFAYIYKMTVASKNSMLKHRNVNLNTVSLKASDCTTCLLYYHNEET
jgi:hypothetical protein